MYSAKAENQLILPEIAEAMQDYVSIQLDIDNTKIKAASLVAQNIDIKRLIGKENLQRCIGQESTASVKDKELLALIIPPLCYFTYARCLKMFQGILTDSGYIIEGSNEAETRNAAKSVSLEMKGIAETFMLDVMEFLEEESPNDPEVKPHNNTPRVRVFGGEECRGSN